MNKKFTIAITSIVVLIIFWVAMGFEGNEMPYVTINELNELTENTKQDRFRLGGKIGEGSIVEDDKDQLLVSFLLQQDEYTLPVSYRGIRPDMFKDGADVIVEGKYENGTFIADNLMTKCASRYEGDLTEESL